MKRRVLLPHQKKALEWARGRNQIALFHQMRLGKTLTTIRWAESLRIENRPKLVVAPLPVLATWQDELQLEGYEPVLLRGTEQERFDSAVGSDGGSWFLTNYEGLVSRGGKTAKPLAVTTLPWKLVVLDESTKIKNPTSKISKVCTRFFSAPYRVILSGLPNPEGSQDFFTQMLFLRGSFMGHTNFWSWRDEYFIPSGYDWNPKLGAMRAISDAVSEVSHWLRRSDVRMGGPSVSSRRNLTLPAAVRTVYCRVAKDFVLGDLPTNWATVCQTWLGQICGGFSKEPMARHNAKAYELLDLLQGELRNKPVVVWFRFNEEIDGVRDLLWKNRIDAHALWGRASLGERNRTVRSFQKGEFDVLLTQVKCATFGLNFSRARTAIYYSPVWSHQEMSQTMDRIVHPLKKDSVLLLFLLMENTVDEKCYNAYRSKKLGSSLFYKDIWSHLEESAKKGNK